MKRIFPDVKARAVQLSVTASPAGECGTVREDIRRLETLVEEANTVLLLTDSRDSRLASVGPKYFYKVRT